MQFLQLPFLNIGYLDHIISYLGAIQGIIIAIVVWNYPQQHKISNRILSLFIVSLVYLYIGNVIMPIINVSEKWMYYGLRTLSPIVLLLYIQSLYRKELDRNFFWLMLIIPVDFLVLYYINHLKNNSSTTVFDWKTLNQLWFLILYLLYLPIIYKQYKEYKSKVYQNFSNTHNIGLKWVTQLFWGYLFIITFDYILSLLMTNTTFSKSSYLSLVSMVAFTAYIYFIAIKGKLSPEIYQLRCIEDQDQEIEPITELSEEKENATESKELFILSQQITTSIEKDRLFKEMGLTINDLAATIGAQPYLVSQAINACLGKNFFELINRYRIEEAKKLLLDSSNNYLSIVGVGFEAGFNSKTAFNTAFKKYTGMTPSEFKTINKPTS